MLKREFAGYNASKLMKDLMAGLTVTAVSLPLALAFGFSSGADAAAGLITAIVASLVIGALSGASYQISGPTGTMTVVLFSALASHGSNGIFLICFMAGIIRVLCGIFKLGKLVELIPRPVITGFTSGIALLIISQQIDPFFGTTSAGTSTIEKLMSYGKLGFSPNLITLLLGVIVVAIMIFWPKKWNNAVPSSLVGIIVSTVVFVIFKFEGVDTVGEIPKQLFLENRLDLGAVTPKMILELFPSAITVAALCMIETLLCGASASEMKKEPFDADIELVAQGVGNMIIPFFGGVPATAALARTSVAIRSGAQTRLTTIFHAMWMLAAMFLLGSVISLIPMSSLGGVLIVSAWKMNNWPSIKYMFKRKFAGAIIQYLATMIVTVVFDLTVAIIVGIVCALVAFAKSAAHIHVSSSGVNAQRMENKGGIGEGHEDSLVVYVTGNIFFANVNRFTEKMRELPECGEMIISMRGVPDVDITSMEAISGLAREWRGRGMRVVFCALDEDVERIFRQSGFFDELGEECFFSGVDKALTADAVLINA